MGQRKSLALSFHSMNKGFLLVLLSALCFSTKAIFAKLGYAAGADALQMLGLRMAFALPVFLVLLVREERCATRPLSRREFVSLAALGLLGYYLSSLLDFLGLQYVSASLERLVLFLYPTLAVILGASLDRKLPPPIVWGSLLLSYGGMALSLGEVHATSAQWLGIVLVFGSTLTYAVYLTGVERWVPKLAPSRITAWAMTISCLAVLLHSGLSGSFSKPMPTAAYGWGAIMALVSTIAPSLLLSFGIRRIGAGPAAIASSLGPVSTILLANLFLGEVLTWRQGIGGLLIIAGVLLLGVRTRTQKPALD